jgi:hypothetical protein
MRAFVVSSLIAGVGLAGLTAAGPQEPMHDHENRLGNEWGYVPNYGYKCDGIVSTPSRPRPPPIALTRRGLGLVVCDFCRVAVASPRPTSPRSRRAAPSIGSTSRPTRASGATP